MVKSKIGLIQCSVCGWSYEIDMNKVEAGELRAQDAIAVIEKHLREEHNAEPTTAIRKKPTLVN